MNPNLAKIDRTNEHYTFELAQGVKRTTVTFRNHFGIELAGDLYSPESAASADNIIQFSSKTEGSASEDENVRTTLSRDPSEISMLDIYNAVEKKEETIFRFHENPNEACPVGGRIHEVLDDELEIVTKCMEKELDGIRLSALIEKIPKSRE